MFQRQSREVVDFQPDPYPAVFTPDILEPLGQPGCTPQMVNAAINQLTANVVGLTSGGYLYEQLILPNSWQARPPLRSLCRIMGMEIAGAINNGSMSAAEIVDLNSYYRNKEPVARLLVDAGKKKPTYYLRAKIGKLSTTAALHHDDDDELPDRTVVNLWHVKSPKK